MATLAPNFSYASPPKIIAVLPFRINAENDLSFLRESILDMLTSRLSRSGRLVTLNTALVEPAIESIIKSGAINVPTARRIGMRLNADFVLFGSLTIFGNGVSIDAKMVDVFGRKPTLIFFDQSQELGAVITIINLLSADIYDEIINSTQVASVAKAAGVEENAPVGENIAPGEKGPQSKTEPQRVVVPSPKITPLTEIENIDERSVRRENWLLSQDATYYTIQIMGAHQEEYLLSFIKENQLLKQNKIAYYQSTLNSKAWFRLLYGIYPTVKEAQLADNKLPANIRKAKPWIRRISTIQKEILDRIKQ